MKARRLIRHGIRQIEVEDFEIGVLPLKKITLPYNSHSSHTR